MRSKWPGIIPLLLMPLSLGGCQDTISEEEQGKIATAYAEMLIAKNMVSGDSATAQHTVDSVLKQYGFDSEKQLMERLRKLTVNPDQLRQTLDSAQHRMEQAQNEAADPMQR